MFSRWKQFWDALKSWWVLKLIFFKSKLGGVEVEQNVLCRLMACLNCKIMDIPFNFLGILMGGKPKEKKRLGIRLLKRWKQNFVHEALNSFPLADAFVFLSWHSLPYPYSSFPFLKFLSMWKNDKLFGKGFFCVEVVVRRGKFIGSNYLKCVYLRKREV